MFFFVLFACELGYSTVMLGTYAKGGSGTTAVGVATGIVAPGITMSIFGIPTLSKVGFF